MLEKSWSDLKDKVPDDQVEYINNVLSDEVEKHFPEKVFKVTNKDKPFMTLELKKLDRKRKKEWKKRGKTAEYQDLNNEYKTKF